MTRLRDRLDHLLAPWVHRGLDALQPRVREILRLGAYQVLYMDGVPTYAAVSASVDQARALVGPKPAGLVNAVLRKLEGHGDPNERFGSPEADPATFLSAWGSHPRWLVERWLERWSVEECKALVDADNRRPDLFVCPLEETIEAAVERLTAAGMGAEPAGGGSRCVRLAQGSSPTKALAALPASIVQDPGANLVVLYSDVPPGMKVADLCAAPGGKVLATTDRSHHTLAMDRSESRIQMLRENAARVGRSLSLAVADARHPPLASADVVLLDAPCTGTGTLARHPDARWRLRPESVSEMATLQRAMISAAAEVVASGGLLVYSTCSLEPEENADVVHALLADRSDFRVEKTGSVPEVLLDDEGMLHVTPQATGFDGAFAARLRKVA